MPFASRLALSLCVLWPLLAPAQSVAERGLLICVSGQASPALAQAAAALAAEARQVPALRGLLETQGSRGSVSVATSESLMLWDARGQKQKPEAYRRAACNHLVVIGLKSQDPVMAKTWGTTASLDEATASFYMEGYGHLQGDLGFVESDRNPFLHSQQTRASDFDTCFFRLSGTTEAGVLAAVTAFRGGLLNGVVPAGPLRRPQTTILDLDPAPDPCPLPLPATVDIPDPAGQLAPAMLAGWTQAPGNEYRAYLDWGGAEPQRVWRLKYLQTNTFNRVGPQGWTCGFHRLAWGNAVTVAQFATPAAAAQTVAAIRQGADRVPAWTAAKLPGGRSVWQTPQPKDETVDASFGSVFLFAAGRHVVFSSLPPDASATLSAALATPGTGAR